MMKPVVLDRDSFSDDHLDLLNSNDLFVLDDGLQDALQNAALAFSSSQLEGSFKATKADVDAVGIQKLNKLVSVVGASIQQALFWRSCPLNPTIT